MIVARLPRAHGGRRSFGGAVFVALLAASILPIPGTATGADRVSVDLGAIAPATPTRPAPMPAAAPVTAPWAPATTLATPATTLATPATTLATPAAAVSTDTVPALPAGAAPDAPDPSTAYEQAMAHADDDVTFAPGGRVTVGFTPRASDTWPIDGRRPTALPAGLVTGSDMAAAAQGSTWSRHGAGATPGTDPGVAAETPADQPIPSGGSSGAIPAHGASWSEPVTADPVTTIDPAAARGLRRQVFGFLPYWELSNASSKLNYDVLSTIAYFSVGATGKGDLRKRDTDGSSTTGWGGWTSSSMTRVINDAHARGTRVVLTISVFAWTSTQASVQRSLLGSPAARRNLAKQAAAAVRDRGADGINLDFEPLASGYSSEFVALLKTMRTELNKVRKGYQLTYDTTGFIGNYPLQASVGSGAADAIFIMGYDYRTSGSSSAGSIDPLSGGTYDLADTVRSYTARVSPSRLILGLPWYGRAWSTTSDKPRARNQSGAKYGYSTAVNYETLAGLVAEHGRHWDKIEQSPYVVYRRENCTNAYGCVTSWRQVWYDDAQSTRARLSLVNDYGLRGAGMWALGYDGGHAELYRAFAESFLVDKTAPQSGIVATPGVEGDEGFIVSWKGKDTSAIRSFDVQVSVDGGDWTDWLLATKATSEVFSGSDGHGYAFRVRARDAKGNAGAYLTRQVWTATPELAPGGFGRVTRDGLAYRSGPGTETARLGSLPDNTIVAITRGPVSEDGYTWYEVTQPIREWPPVSFVERGVWIAAAKGSDSFVKPYRSPASTRVDAAIRNLDFGPDGATGTGPGASALAVRAFSPDADGSEDTIRVRWTSSIAFDSLALRVYRTDGSAIGSVPVAATGKGDRSFSWDGTVDGRRLKDGHYQVQLVGKADGTTYTAPSARPVTRTQLALYAVTIDTVNPKLTSASASRSLISPNGDGVLESVRLALGSGGGATRWTISLAPRGGGAVRTASGTGTRASLTWTGRADDGTRAPDGAYVATLTAWDTAGNRASRSFPITVDTKAPAVAPTVSNPVFAPNGDGAVDATVLGWTSSEKASGVARIYRGKTLIRSWTIRAAGSWSVTWNGRTAGGKPVADGRYTFRVSVKDAAGNARSVTAPVVVDRTAGALRWAGSFYPQDGDALRATSALTWTLKRAARTTLRLYDERGELVRTVWSGKAQKAGDRRWTWDGRLADGSWAPQGVYTARMSVESSLGTVVLARDVRAAGFEVTPSASSVRPGRTLTVTIRPTEPLGARPSVSFTQPGRGAVTVTATRLANGSYRASFTVRKGDAGAASVKVSARDSAGGRNTTTITVRVTS
jgi:spore germination protein YaaH/flagellar hook assembly protein FlgD